MTESNDLFSIVVVGAMNPSIHHPAWYRPMDILTEEESKRSEESGMILAVTQQISQFSSGAFTVVCEPHRWQVQTRHETQLQRLREIADKTFEILYHTQVSAFGFNFTYHRKTSLSEVNTTLAMLIESLPIGLKPTGRRAAKINIRLHQMDECLRSWLNPPLKAQGSFMSQSMPSTG